jgi:hypothetical protein
MAATTPRPRIVGFFTERDADTGFTHDYYELACGHRVIAKHGVTRPRANVRRTPCHHCALVLRLAALGIAST